MIALKRNAFTLITLPAMLLLGNISPAKAQDNFQQFLAQNKAQETASHTVETTGLVLLVAAVAISWWVRRQR